MTTSPTMRLAAAALIGLASATAALAPAHAGETKKETTVDMKTTASISAPERFCDPKDPKAGLVCRVTRGEPDARYPSAPVNPAFGF